MKKYVVGCLGLVLLLSAQSVQAAPIAVIDANGLYTGFTGIDVGGTLYDVKFVEGSMFSLFGNPPVADFADSNAAAAASTQLLFALAATPALDAAPELTSGCSEYGNLALACFIWTSYTADSLGFNVIELRNGKESEQLLNGLNDINVANTVDTTTLRSPISGSSWVYADWSVAGTPDPIPTPEPATVSLIGLGFAGLVSRARNHRRSR